jgi:hypothetical protein
MHTTTLFVTAKGVTVSREMHRVDARLLRGLLQVGQIVLVAMSLALLAAAATGISTTVGNLGLCLGGVGLGVAALRVRDALAKTSATAKPTPNKVESAKPIQPAARCRCGARIVEGKCLNRTCKTNR